MLVPAASIFFFFFVLKVEGIKWKLVLFFYLHLFIKIPDRMWHYYGVGPCTVDTDVYNLCHFFPQCAAVSGRWAESMLIISHNERWAVKTVRWCLWRQVSLDRFDLSNMYSISSLTTREPPTKVSAQRQGAPWEMSLSKCVPASHFCGISTASEGSD